MEILGTKRFIPRGFELQGRSQDFSKGGGGGGGSHCVKVRVLTRLSRRPPRCVLA